MRAVYRLVAGSALTIGTMCLIAGLVIGDTTWIVGASHAVLAGLALVSLSLD